MATAQPQPPKGDQVFFSWQSFGLCYVIRLDRGKLLAATRDYPLPFPPGRIIRRSPDHWKALWTEVAAAGVWDWKPKYDSGDVLDGGLWSLRLCHGGRFVRSQGCNDYPGGRGEEFDPGCSFDRVERALRKLADLPDEVEEA